MGLFSPNFDNHVPEGPDLPRKEGAARLWELLGRDWGRFFKAGLLSFTGALPFLVGMTIAVQSRAVVPMLLSGIVGGMLAAPQVCGVADTILRSMRDEPGFWWHTYRKAWKRNAASSLIPGAVFGLVYAAQIFAFYHIAALSNPLLTLLILVISALLSLGLASYCFPMLTLMELSQGSLLKNSLLLFPIHLPRSLLAGLLQFVWFALMLFFLPVSMPVLVLGNFWIPLLLSYMVIYPILEEHFHIEEAIARRQRRELEENRPKDVRHDESHDQQKG